MSLLDHVNKLVSSASTWGERPSRRNLDGTPRRTRAMSPQMSQYDESPRRDLSQTQPVYPSQYSTNTPSQPQFQPRENVRRHRDCRAFIVGLDYLWADPGMNIPYLNGAVADAKRMAHVLTQFYEFEPNEILLLTDESRQKDVVTRQAVRDGWRWLTSNVSPGDTLVFYYAGHTSSVHVPVRERPPQLARDNDLTALCVSDGMVFKYEIWEALQNLPAGCSITCFIDAPFGQTILNADNFFPPPERPVDHDRDFRRPCPGVRFMPPHAPPGDWHAGHIPAKAMRGLPDGINGFVFCACSLRDVARELPPGAEQDQFNAAGGLFTIALCEVMIRSSKNTATVMQVFEALQQRMHDLVHGQHGAQTPTIAWGHAGHSPQDISFIHPPRKPAPLQQAPQVRNDYGSRNDLSSQTYGGPLREFNGHPQARQPDRRSLGPPRPDWAQPSFPHNARPVQPPPPRSESERWAQRMNAHRQGNLLTMDELHEQMHRLVCMAGELKDQLDMIPDPAEAASSSPTPVAVLTPSVPPPSAPILASNPPPSAIVRMQSPANMQRIASGNLRVSSPAVPPPSSSMQLLYPGPQGTATTRARSPTRLTPQVPASEPRNSPYQPPSFTDPIQKFPVVRSNKTLGIASPNGERSPAYPSSYVARSIPTTVKPLVRRSDPNGVIQNSPSGGTIARPFEIGTYETGPSGTIRSPAPRSPAINPVGAKQEAPWPIVPALVPAEHKEPIGGISTVGSTKTVEEAHVPQVGAPIRVGDAPT